MTSLPAQAIFLTSESPYPQNGGGKIREAQLLRLLSERMEVEVLCFGSESSSTQLEATSGLRLTSVVRDKAPFWKRVLYPVRPYVVNGFSSNMAEALRERARPGKILWVSRLAMAQYIPLARSLGYRVVLDQQNVESAVWLETALSSPRRWPSTFLALQCAYYEERFCEASDTVVAASDIDASRFQKLAPDVPVHVIPNTVNSSDFKSGRDRPGTTIFFSGTLTYEPNLEALRWFSAEILPRLRRALGKDLPPIIAAGANPSPEFVQEMRAAGIEVRANPPSMLPLLSEAAVVVVPVRSGGGTRLKILEAMAAGRAVVSTGKGAEGLLLSPSEDIFIADHADAFTSAVVRLLRDPALRVEVGRRAARTIEERYDWRCARPLLNEVLSRLAATRSSSEGNSTA